MTGSTTPGATSPLTDGTAAGGWVLDPAGSSTQFRVRHFWGAITVRGTLSPTAGEAAVSPDGTVTGRISFDARSLDTGHKQRDKQCHGALDVAGHARPVTFTAHIQESAGGSVVLTAELQVDRAEFGMTWSPLHTASMTALGTVTARFTRA